MLKKCYGLFLGLVVLAGSVCVTPTHASSASIIITNVRAGSPTSAAEEGVVLYNNSSFEVNVTNWCLTNKSVVKFACFTPASQYEISSIPAYSYATLVSTKAVHSDNQANYSVVYEPAASSSGSIVAGSDTISLIDAGSQLIDQFTWYSSVSSSQQWARTKLSLLPDVYIDTDASIDWQKVVFNEFPISQVQYREDLPDNPPEEPIEEPEEPEEPIDNPGDADPTPQPEGALQVVVTELLPNAIGSDTGNEFIELYNPNETANISLKGNKLAIGPVLERVYVLSEYILKPGEYRVFTNTELGYSLLNTSSRVTLFTPAGDIASEVPAYSAPPDGEAWALIEDTWQYTSQPTPGAHNIKNVSKQEEASPKLATTSTPKPCAANQYRSPETNRCRLISSTSGTSPTLCKAGQERNEETNRCRNIATTTTTACKEGQEKNPETNRCRNIKQLSSVGFGVKGATTKQQGGIGWYMWAAIVGVVLLIVGYGVWEWREELKKLFQAAKAKFAGKPN